MRESELISATTWLAVPTSGYPVSGDERIVQTSEGKLLPPRGYYGERTVENFPGVGYDPYSPRGLVCFTCHSEKAPCGACLPDELTGKSDDGLNGYVIIRRA